MSATAKNPQKPYLPAMGHDRLLPFYDPLQRLLGIESVHRQLVDQARIQPDQRLLEIGCGTGNLAILIKRLHPDAEVVGFLQFGDCRQTVSGFEAVPDNIIQQIRVKINGGHRRLSHLFI